MIDKKGFTLVELLAVIAILAILVIIALPNVLNMFMDAKKELFLTEARNIIKQVKSKYIDENLKGNHISTVSNNNNNLDLSGNIKYEIEMDNQGNILDYIISNDNYCISSSKKYDELTKDDVQDDCSYEKLHNIAGTLSKSEFQKIARGNLITTISFYSDGRVIDGAEKYDVSEAQDNSIILYAKEESESSSYLDLSVVAEGKIAFPEDSSRLFGSLFISYSSTGSWCNVKSINFNHAIDTSKVSNMSGMFTQAGSMNYYHPYNPDKTRAMEAMDLSDFNTSNVTNMGWMFQGFRGKIIGLNGFDMSKVQDVTGMFSNTRAEILDLSGFDTSNITDMSRLFDYTGAKEIKGLDKLNTSKVTNMSDMFRGANTTIIDISKFDTSKVINMNGMFQGSSTNKIVLGGIDTSNVEDMRMMFSYSKISEIYGMSMLKTNNLKSMIGMFEHTTGLTTIDLSSFDLSKVDSSKLESAFESTAATIGYAKNNESAAKLNASSKKPNTLTFMVKK